MSKPDRGWAVGRFNAWRGHADPNAQGDEGLGQEFEEQREGGEGGGSLMGNLVVIAIIAALIGLAVLVSAVNAVLGEHGAAIERAIGQEVYQGWIVGPVVVSSLIALGNVAFVWLASRLGAVRRYEFRGAYAVSWIAATGAIYLAAASLFVHFEELSNAPAWLRSPLYWTGAPALWMFVVSLFHFGRNRVAGATVVLAANVALVAAWAKAVGFY